MDRAKAMRIVLQQTVPQYERARGEIRPEPQVGGGIVQ
jgi:hypothetical protein